MITLPATVVDSGRPIEDVATAAATGAQPARQILTAPGRAPNRIPIALGVAAALGAAALAWRVWVSRQKAHWRRLITAAASLGAQEEAAAGPIAPAAPSVAVRARLAPGDARMAGPVSIRRIS
jgi:hypothetical protein